MGLREELVAHDATTTTTTTTAAAAETETEALAELGDLRLYEGDRRSGEPAEAAAAEAEGGELASSAERSDWACPICLNDVPFVETAIVKGCNHLFCATCILNWVLFKLEQRTGHRPSAEPSSPRCEPKCICPTCRNPFDVLCVQRQLDGTLSETLVEENVSLLLRAKWFDNEKFVKYRKGKAVLAPASAQDTHDSMVLSMSPNTRKLYGADDYMEAAYDNDYDDYYDEDKDYYDEDGRYASGGSRRNSGGGSSSGSSSSTKVVIGNRRWGQHGYVNSGRMYARPSNQSTSGQPKGKGKKKAQLGKGKGFDDDYGEDEYKPARESPAAKKSGMGRRASRAAKRAMKNKGGAKNALDRAIC